jgi:ubiquitin-protein ligase
MNLSKKRILVDMKNIRNNEDLQKCGIHVNFNEDNIYNVQALIIGPKGTPYENGFYLFDINFPNDYPMEPPKVKMCTLDSKIRFNPNLYTCGKVCLSIINTWSGPGWTSCLTLNSVLLSIQSLLNEIPLRNEPGFEKELIDGDNSVKYNRIIEYYNIKVAVLRMLDTPPQLFECFRDIMAKYYMENIVFYEEYINNNMHLHNNTFTTKIYSLNDKFNFNALKMNMDKLKKKYETILVNKVESSIINKRKKPDLSAMDFEEGYKIISEHDGNEYIVKVINPKKVDSQLSKSYKRWMLSSKNN